MQNKLNKRKESVSEVSTVPLAYRGRGKIVLDWGGGGFRDVPVIWENTSLPQFYMPGKSMKK
jgi:hypothetical protein